MGLQWHWLETLAVAEEVIQVVLKKVAPWMMSRGLILRVAQARTTRLACDVRTASRARARPRNHMPLALSYRRA